MLLEKSYVLDHIYVQLNIFLQFNCHPCRKFVIWYRRQSATIQVAYSSDTFDATSLLSPVIHSSFELGQLWENINTKYIVLFFIFTFGDSRTSIPTQGGHSLCPVKNGGINRCIFPLHFLHSLHSQAHFSFCKFKIFVHSTEFIHGDLCRPYNSTYFYNKTVYLKRLAGTQNHCQARQSSAFWGEWARLFGDRSHGDTPIQPQQCI